MLHDFAPVYKIVQECFADVHELQRGVFQLCEKAHRIYARGICDPLRGLRD